MLRKVVSGGQTGVDRGALDAAAACGVACGGWCPRGRRAEDGPIPDAYPLRETTSSDYRERTQRNVVESDATLIIARGALSGGTALTRDLAQRAGRPCLLLDLGSEPRVEPIREWLRAHDVRVLNVAGPRESQQPGIQREARRLLTAVLRSLGTSARDREGARKHEGYA
ncbi:MAG: molybdenum cofactor carrier [Gammaproteobacteria bacterium]|nr:molybdenum cofactor carrier [Gammaproteobacteria bacterium]NIR59751.1 molybdenum cofactor carrier [Gammaproteobacteria bacterium]NIR89561.1 molybdenum cofactor carrier [Gammaproteobacteria bacterium]NIV74803.1 molybdenum cofactor carrier [Gammaproteobacteria bacterium]